MIRLFTFSPIDGLPTSGPFGLKLEACLRMLDVEYERVFEDDVRKGPKRKSPWIEDGSLKLGDTELILDYVQKKHGKTLDAHLTDAQRAQSLVLQRMLEEHYHQCFEYELVVHPVGWAWLRPLVTASIPFPVSALAAPMIRKSFTKHLFERGIARHTADEVERMGRADLDALAGVLGDRDWFVADRPSKVDATAFGLLAMTILSGIQTPMMSYARTLDSLVRFVERARAEFFPELESAAKKPAATAAA